MPIARTWEVIDYLLQLYECLYRHRRLPFTLIELRFTPAGHTRSLISPGAGAQRHVYVNLVCNQSGAFAEYYAVAEDYVREIGAKPQLGKWCESWTSADLAQVHGPAFEHFKKLRRQHDPDGHFRNTFTDRVLDLLR